MNRYDALRSQRRPMDRFDDGCSCMTRLPKLVKGRRHRTELVG